MSDVETIDYGPLAVLIGTWKGDKGVDIAPEPDGTENNPYYESITFSAIGEVDNAESQLLTVLHYRQIVQRQSNDKVIHDETGYWMWDVETGVIMHSLAIPRGVSILAGGLSTTTDNGEITLKVSAKQGDKDWQILQSPFMRDNARTMAFQHEIHINKDILNYSETTTLDIYGKVFEHTDKNELIRQ